MFRESRKDAYREKLTVTKVELLTERVPVAPQWGSGAEVSRWGCKEEKVDKWWGSVDSVGLLGDRGDQDEKNLSRTKAALQEITTVSFLMKNFTKLDIKTEQANSTVNATASTVLITAASTAASTSSNKAVKCIAASTAASTANSMVVRDGFK